MGSYGLKTAFSIYRVGDYSPYHMLRNRYLDIFIPTVGSELDGIFRTFKFKRFQHIF